MALARWSRLSLALLPALVLAVGFYTWTAATSDSLRPGSYNDAYNQLVDGFADGHLYLPTKPDPAFSRLPDPYLPKYNAKLITPETQDLVLHHDRFYTQWGVAPALVLFWPFRALGAGDLPPGLAVLVLCLVGIGALLALLRLLVARFLPAAPSWAVGVAATVLVFANLAPWLLRRPKAYEVAISGGMAFFWTGMLLLASGLLAEEVGRKRLAGASLCFGLAFASRPPTGIAIAIAVAVLVLLVKEGRMRRWPAAALLLGPAAAILVGVGIYNALRFGSPLDFGTTEVLAGSKNDKFFSLAYLAPNLWFYVLCPVRLLAAFPFFWVNVPHVPFGVSSLYDQPERTAGLLSTVPFLLMAVVAVPALRGTAVLLRRAVLAWVAAGLALLLFTSIYYWGAIERYEADFAALLVLPVALIWLAFLARPAASGRARRARVAVAAVGTALAAVTVVVWSAISLIGSDDLLRARHPGTFASLRGFFSPVSALFADAAGHPILADVNGDPLDNLRYDHFWVDSGSFYLGTAPYTLQVVSGSTERGVLRAQMRRTAAVPPAKLLVESRSPDGSVFSVEVPGTTARSVDIPVSLERGENELSLRVFADRQTPIPAYAISEDTAAVRLEGLTIRSAPPR